MKIILFYHSLVSDWNHGNAHFLRGVARELIRRGHDVEVFEPANNWSLTNLWQQNGRAPIEEFQTYYPELRTNYYNLPTLDLDATLAGADLVLVHEWNDHKLVKAIGEHRRKHDYVLLFHDTHHRAVTERESIANYDLRYYDGVLAFGALIRDLYIRNTWSRAAWTWHEAADTTVFSPKSVKRYEGDLVWVGNWGDDERTRELEEFLIRPVERLGLRATIYGVRYPDKALKRLEKAGIRYGGWLPNYKVPEVFAKYRVTLHVPRRPYVESLPGIPTIRPFEAMACGIPLLSAPWSDTEGLFRAGEDFLYATSGRQMTTLLERVLSTDSLARSLAASGRKTILEKHTCSDRVNELETIYEEVIHRKARAQATKSRRLAARTTVTK